MFCGIPPISGPNICDCFRPRQIDPAAERGDRVVGSYTPLDAPREHQPSPRSRLLPMGFFGLLPHSSQEASTCASGDRVRPKEEYWHLSIEGMLPENGL